MCRRAAITRCLLLISFLAHTCAFARFIQWDGRDPNDLGKDPAKHLIVFMSGGGSATDADRISRAARLQAISADVQVVVFAPPSGWLVYPSWEMSKLQSYLAERRSHLGNGNLHFLASSAAAAPFEAWLYDSDYLPAQVGVVILAQPFLPEHPFRPARPILDASVEARLYTVIGVRMPDPQRAYFDAGPSRTANPNMAIHLIQVGDPRCVPNEDNWIYSQTWCQHAATVGWSEDLAVEVFREYVTHDLAAAERRVQEFMANNGNARPDQLCECIDLKPDCPILQGTWTAHEEGSLTICITGLGCETDPIDGTLSKALAQSGCEITWIDDAMGVSVTRRATLVGNAITIPPQDFVIPQPGTTMQENAVSGTGTVYADRIVMNAQGVARGSGQGLTFNINASTTTTWTGNKPKYALRGIVTVTSGPALNAFDVLYGLEGTIPLRLRMNNGRIAVEATPGRYTVRLEQTGYTFSPASQTLDVQGNTELVPFVATPNQATGITAQRQGNGLAIHFVGKLESADSIEGPYNVISNSSSPFSVTFEKEKQFYRVSP